MGKGETGVVDALEDIRRAAPFPLKAIDSDNGSEFINYHLYRYCKKHRLQFTRSRAYKKNDNAHIEQKNWTHVRKLLGWERYDTPAQLHAINALYNGPWRAMMNLYQPCVKLKEKARVGPKITRRYDQAQTPLDRLVAFYTKQALPKALRALLDERERTDPFRLSETIDKALGLLTRAPAQNRKRNNAVLAHKFPSPRGGEYSPTRPQPPLHG